MIDTPFFSASATHRLTKLRLIFILSMGIPFSSAIAAGSASQPQASVTAVSAAPASQTSVGSIPAIPAAPSTAAASDVQSVNRSLAQSNPGTAMTNQDVQELTQSGVISTSDAKALSAWTGSN